MLLLFLRVTNFEFIFIFIFEIYLIGTIIVNYKIQIKILEVPNKIKRFSIRKLVKCTKI